ncbi:MAG: hypothetical protein HOL58_07090 [Francisellaceae bacterium]|jgi:hypothetical protein|nr:hypothetical protein [Francisellaceae bacterium]
MNENELIKNLKEKIKKLKAENKHLLKILTDLKDLERHDIEESTALENSRLIELIKKDLGPINGFNKNLSNEKITIDKLKSIEIELNNLKEKYKKYKENFENQLAGAYAIITPTAKPPTPTPEGIQSFSDPRVNKRHMALSSPITNSALPTATTNNVTYASVNPTPPPSEPKYASAKAAKGTYETIPTPPPSNSNRVTPQRSQDATTNNVTYASVNPTPPPSEPKYASAKAAKGTYVTVPTPPPSNSNRVTPQRSQDATTPRSRTTFLGGLIKAMWNKIKSLMNIKSDRKKAPQPTYVSVTPTPPPNESQYASAKSAKGTYKRLSTPSEYENISQPTYASVTPTPPPPNKSKYASAKAAKAPHKRLSTPPSDGYASVNADGEITYNPISPAASTVPLMDEATRPIYQTISKSPRTSPNPDYVPVEPDGYASIHPDSLPDGYQVITPDLGVLTTEQDNRAPEDNHHRAIDRSREKQDKAGIAEFRKDLVQKSKIKEPDIRSSQNNARVTPDNNMQ